MGHGQTFLAGGGIVSPRSPFLHDHSATAPVLELRPAALRSELAYRALRVSDSSPIAGSASLSKNFFSWQRGHAATWEQRTFAPTTGKCVPSNRAKGETPCKSNRPSPSSS